MVLVTFKVDGLQYSLMRLSIGNHDSSLINNRSVLYLQFDPPISMGCVRSPLYCEHTKMKPMEMENEEWPYTQCCFSELCNRHIQIPENSKYFNLLS